MDIMLSYPTQRWERRQSAEWRWGEGGRRNRLGRVKINHDFFSISNPKPPPTCRHNTLAQTSISPVPPDTLDVGPIAAFLPSEPGWQLEVVSRW